jgi:hypothetical protein
MQMLIYISCEFIDIYLRKWHAFIGGENLFNLSSFYNITMTFNISLQ